MEHPEIENEYRIITNPSPQVQKLYKGEWVTAHYCTTLEVAQRCLAKSLEQDAEWVKLSPEERRARILRYRG